MEKSSSQRAIDKIRRHWQLYLIILLPMLYIIIFHYVPMYGIQIAFKKYYVTKGIMGSPWIGLKNFQQLFKSPFFFRTVANTLTISLYWIVASFPLPIMLAIGLNEVRNKLFAKSVQMVTYAPFFISTVIMVGILFQVLDPRIGLVNRIIGLFGVETINFMGEPTLFKSLYVWSGIWQTTGYGAIIYLAALSGVDPQLQEAAIIDGASKVQRIWHVDLPSIKPTIVILLILAFSRVMSVGFERIYLMQNPLNVRTSEVVATYVYKVGLLSADFSFSTTIGLFNSIVNLILLLTANTLAKKFGETSLW